jgi:hypothetical protein
MWLRLDDAFVEHPKVIGLSDLAFRLHIKGLCYSSRYLTDGHVPETAVKDSKLTKELTRSGLWAKAEGGWLIHDFLEYNPSREQVLEDRRRARERRANVTRTSGERNPNGQVYENPNVGRTSSSPSRPVLEVQEQDQELPPSAGDEDEWMQVPPGWTDQEAALYRKLFAQNPNWSGLTFGGMNGLNKKHGTSTVTEALRRVYEEAAEPTKPYALVDSICVAIKQQETLDA